MQYILFSLHIAVDDVYGAIWDTLNLLCVNS